MKPCTGVRTIGWLMVSVWLATASPGGSQEQIHIIANQSVSQNSVSGRQVRLIFLDMKSTWDDGGNIQIAILDGGDAHNVFLDKYLGMSTANYKNYWLERVFTGKGGTPTTFADEESLAAFVARTPGAVGYVSTIPARPGIKVLAVQ